MGSLKIKKVTGAEKNVNSEQEIGVIQTLAYLVKEKQERAGWNPLKEFMGMLKHLCWASGRAWSLVRKAWSQHSNSVEVNIQFVSPSYTQDLLVE